MVSIQKRKDHLFTEIQRLLINRSRRSDDLVSKLEANGITLSEYLCLKDPLVKYSIVTTELN